MEEKKTKFWPISGQISVPWAPSHCQITVSKRHVWGRGFEIERRGPRDLQRSHSKFRQDCADEVAKVHQEPLAIPSPTSDSTRHCQGRIFKKDIYSLHSNAFQCNNSMETKEVSQGFLFYTFSENRRAWCSFCLSFWIFSWVFPKSCLSFFPDSLSFLSKSIISCKYCRENALFLQASRSLCQTLG